MEIMPHAASTCSSHRLFERLALADAAVNVPDEETSLIWALLSGM
jgi:hypothetical protein